MLALSVLLDSPEILTFLAGVSVHQLFLRHGEWNLHGPAFLATAVAAWWPLFIVHTARSQDPFAAFVFALKVTWSGIAGIFLSMTVYRLLFHRLRSFPGPLGAKVTSWWASTLHGPRWHFFLGMSGLHKQYGDYVRVGKGKYQQRQ